MRTFVTCPSHESPGGSRGATEWVGRLQMLSAVLGLCHTVSDGL
jgi:hypothetical protein